MTTIAAEPQRVAAARLWTRLRTRWQTFPAKARVGATMFLAFVVLAIAGPLVTPFNPSYANPLPSLSLHAPDVAHLLGTTQSGQDVLSQLLTGIGLTMEIGLSVGIITTALSVTVGVTAGFLGGFWDEILTLVCNIFLVLPLLPLLIVLLSYKAAQGEMATILVLSILGWPWGARLIRAQTISLARRDFVLAAGEAGESTWRVLLFEMVPHEIGLIASNFVSTVLYAIGTSVALAFLGLANLSNWSLGTMLYWAQNQSALQLGAWWWFLPPGLAVALMGTSLVLLNFGLDELTNPRLRTLSRRGLGGKRRWRPMEPTPVVVAGEGSERRPN